MTSQPLQMAILNGTFYNPCFSDEQSGAQRCNRFPIPEWYLKGKRRRPVFLNLDLFIQSFGFSPSCRAASVIIFFVLETRSLYVWPWTCDHLSSASSVLGVYHNRETASVFPDPLCEDKVGRWKEGPPTPSKFQGFSSSCPIPWCLSCPFLTSCGTEGQYSKDPWQSDSSRQPIF